MTRLICLIALSISSPADVLAATPGGGATAFVGVNVIPMDRERVLEDQTVIVRGGVIERVGDARRVKVPKGAVRINGRGKYLIPGLVDMHTHLLSDGEFPDEIAEDELKVMVAQGVTTVRFMIGTPEQLALRAKAAKGEIVAPSIYSASPHLTGKKQGNDYVVTNEREARAAVRESKRAGYDFIKVTTFIAPEVYRAIVDEASKQNIRVVGHADSRFLGLRRALEARQQIEHLDGYLEALLPDEAPVEGSVSDLYVFNPKNWESLDYLDESRIPALARATVAANPFACPTLHFMKATFGRVRTEESIRAQPDFRFYPSKVQEYWLAANRKLRLGEVRAEKRARYVALRDKITKAIHDAGGKILAGSDTPEWLWLYGYSLHRELEALSEAGLSNYAVLAAATRNPSEFFRTLDRVGTVERGKRADLVLLNANPLADISGTQDRAGVMLKGRWFAREELDGWLDRIAPRLQTALDSENRPGFGR